MAPVSHPERKAEPCAWPAAEVFEENLREARRAVTSARHAAEDAVAEAALTIRRNPWRAVGAAVVIGAAGGAVAGFGAARLARTRT